MTIRRFFLGIVVLALLAALMVNFAVAATQTLTGVVSDDMCGKKHTMLPGKSDAECVRACVKAGAHYAVVVGDKIYVLKGDAKQIDALAGKHARVTGEVNGRTITVASISAAK